MTNLLSEFLSAGLLGRIDNDDVLDKIDRAVKTLAQSLSTQPNDLMRGMLAGLDPDIPRTDPSIEKAKQALLAEWRTMLAAYPDEPVGLYRAALLEACHQCAEGTNAVLLWLIAADSVGLLRLGKEEKVVRDFLQVLGQKAEKHIFRDLDIRSVLHEPDQEGANAHANQTKITATFDEVDRDDLRNRVGAAAGPTHKNVAGKNPNPHWSNQQQHWSWEFTDRMTELLADELDHLTEQIQEGQEAFAKNMQSFLQTQRQAIQSAITDHERHRRTEQLRLDALWWSEALYSPALGQSYRELKPEVAALVMAQDLLNVVSLPTPASVAHLLAETVQRLPNAGYEIKKPVGEWLELLRQSTNKPALEFSTVPKEGRLSLRDVFAWAISDQTWDTAQALQRAGIETAHEISLPALSRSLFRQEQACRLANAAKGE